MGRPWLAFWMFPYPNSRGLAVGELPLAARLGRLRDLAPTSPSRSLFWYVGLIPDFATLRDRARGWRRRVYGWLSLGWDGSARTWQRYEKA